MHTVKMIQKVTLKAQKSSIVHIYIVQVSQKNFSLLQTGMSQRFVLQRFNIALQIKIHKL